MAPGRDRNSGAGIFPAPRGWRIVKRYGKESATDHD